MQRRFAVLALVTVVFGGGCTSAAIERMHLDEDKYYTVQDLTEGQRQELVSEIATVTRDPIISVVLHGESLQVTTGNQDRVGSMEGRIHRLDLVNHRWRLRTSATAPALAP